MKILGKCLGKPWSCLKQILRTKNGFPDVIEAAGCMNIAIKAPSDTEDA